MSDKYEKHSNSIVEYTNHRVVHSSFSYWCIGYILSYKGAKNLLEFGIIFIKIIFFQ